MIFKKKESTQELLGIEAITDYGISTKQGELVFFSVAPTNLSVLPADSIDARINALLNIIKGYDGIEMIATDSMQSFEYNKRFYRDRLEKENCHAVRRLLEQDIEHLDRIQVMTASSRQFYIVLRIRSEVKKTFKALCIAQEKTEQYSGQNEVIYVEDITVVKIFMTALQEELDFGMDMYNRWCSGKTKVKVLGDGHISFWANDNRSEYIIKLKSMIVCVPKATSNESPVVIFESDKDTVEQDKQKYISENNPDYLEGLAFPTGSGEPDIVYDPQEIYEYQMHWTYDEDVVIPEHYQIVRFLEQRILCCLNIQGLSYWDFNNFLRQSEKMTGSELADVLKEILAKRK